MRILVVEDDRLLNNTLCYNLNTAGYAVDSALTKSAAGNFLSLIHIFSLGYLNQSFQNAVMEGVLYGCEQGLYGWKVTDCKICFEYGLYYLSLIHI